MVVQSERGCIGKELENSIHQDRQAMRRYPLVTVWFEVLPHLPEIYALKR